MSFPISGSPWGSVAAANPAYATRFIPSLWSGKLIEKFYSATVLAAIANTNYEGEISNMGEKVTIRTKPTITIRDYESTQSLTYERPSSNVVELQIDKGKYFNTILDDVMEVQADVDMLNMWADDAAEQMKIKIDTDVLANLAAGISADNQGDTAGVISNNINLGKATAPLTVNADGSGGNVSALDVIIRLGQTLDEQNIPEQGRWLVIPAWFAAQVKRSDLKDASLAGDGTSILRNGRLGMIDRFTLYSSNLLPISAPSDSATSIFAGHSHGLTFASQLTKMETLRAESTFGTIMRGLQVYGYKVIDGTAIATAYAKSA
jgi:hypothetical protein